tara:strand:+ start:446 stop:643 length:198 start_codon:yes stop_codon:yes gene_type:complete
VAAPILICLLIPSSIAYLISSNSLLLNEISGINLLEIKAQDRWGRLDSYKEYKIKTPQLIPKFWN